MLPLSALGHKRTKRHHGAMSALPPKADIERHLAAKPLRPRADEDVRHRLHRERRSNPELTSPWKNLPGSTASSRNKETNPQTHLALSTEVGSPPAGEAGKTAEKTRIAFKCAHSTLDLPVSHHPKVQSADQLAPVCLGGFHFGRDLLQGARV